MKDRWELDRLLNFVGDCYEVDAVQKPPPAPSKVRSIPELMGSLVDRLRFRS